MTSSYSFSIICPNTGDMDDCNEKPKCKWGECDGQSLPSDEKDYCPAGYDFREDYCDCIAGCFDLYTVVYFVDGQIVTNQVRCSAEYCEDPLIMSNKAPFSGFDPSDIQILSFYSPDTCGIRTRGALTQYRFPVLCDGETDDVLRTYSTVRSNARDVQPSRADVYLAPNPLPTGCQPPAASARQSEGLSTIPSCFILVTSAVNTAVDRIICPAS